MYFSEGLLNEASGVNLPLVQSLIIYCSALQATINWTLLTHLKHNSISNVCYYILPMARMEPPATLQTHHQDQASKYSYFVSTKETAAI